MAARWYAMRSKANKEDFLAGQLESYGIEVFYPRIQVKPVNPRSRKVRPYFPSYLFVHVDLEAVNLTMLRWMPGAVSLISFDGEPASVPDELITSIRRQVDLVNAAGGVVFDEYKAGEHVIVKDGPFADYEAIFDARLSGQDRVRVLLKYLKNRQMPLELPASEIERKK